MAAFHMMAGGSETLARPAVRTITLRDNVDVLRLGLRDFWEQPSHYVFLCLIYPIVGLVLGVWASGANALPLVFPLVSGFALLGPLAAIGLYEISRRRERGLDSSWRHAFEVLRSPAMPAIALVAIMLLVLFVVWLLVAQAIYTSLFGPNPPSSIGVFLSEVFTTTAGWKLIIVGNLAGLFFAVVALATSVIAFPLLLDHDVGALAAVMTSVRAFAANPVPVLAWGLIVAALLVVGSLPFLAGLAIVMPVLGHATWHLYRRLVEAPAA